MLQKLKKGLSKLHPDLPDVQTSEDGKRRYLHLCTPWVQGAMLIAKPDEIALEYVQRMMAWLLFVPDLDALPDMYAVQLGLGAGALSKFCFRRLGMRNTAVELNPKVVLVCRQQFALPPDGARFHVHVADAKVVLEQGPFGAWSRSATMGEGVAGGWVHSLQVDMYDAEAASPVLDNVGVYTQCKALLAPQGMMSVNLFGRENDAPQSLDAIVQAFGVGSVWIFNPTKEGNTIVLAMNGAPGPEHSIALLGERADAIQARWGLPAPQWLRHVRPVSDLPYPL